MTRYFCLVVACGITSEAQVASTGRFLADGASLCTASDVQRRRREASCTCRRRSIGAINVPAGYICKDDRISLCGSNCPRASVNNRQLLVDGQPFHMKGINWNPIGWNKTEPKDRNITSQYLAAVEQDSNLMKAAGINAIRTYGPLTSVPVLDTLWSKGIWVINTAYADGKLEPAAAAEVVTAVKDHPAILMWVIGNEWNYNGIYADLDWWQSFHRLNAAAAIIKGLDSRPVSTIHGGMPSSDLIYGMPDIDVWGLNVYTGASFGNLFDDWWGRSEKPMYFGEYGADAFNANIWDEDQEAQAYATTKLTNEIVSNSAVNDGVCIGGLLFEFSDEWWKDHSGSPAEHDTHGVAPGGGPYPDANFNEEWWGIVDISRKPRLAYWAYKDTVTPGYSGAPTESPAPTPSPPDESLSCQASGIQRRRRQVGMCSCRRRSGASDLPPGWSCQGPNIVSDSEI